jgi:hypothetical protein
MVGVIRPCLFAANGFFVRHISSCFLLVPRMGLRGSRRRSSSRRSWGLGPAPDGLAADAESPRGRSSTWPQKRPGLVMCMHKYLQDQWLLPISALPGVAGAVVHTNCGYVCPDVSTKFGVSSRRCHRCPRSQTIRVPPTRRQGHQPGFGRAQRYCKYGGHQRRL